jgi:hypothetical protein
MTSGAWGTICFTTILVVGRIAVLTTPSDGLHHFINCYRATTVVIGVTI